MTEQVLSPRTLSDPRTRRRVFLDIALRRARPGTGSVISDLQQTQLTGDWPDLTSVLSGIPWAVAGDVATRTYMPERTTQHLGILVAHIHAPQVHTRLRSARYVYQQDLSIGGTAWHSPGGTLLDVVESHEPWVPHALAELRADPQGLPVLSLAYLVLMKVQSSRTQDLADVSRMLGLASAQERQAARDVFRRWYPDALQDLESLIALGDLEMAGGDEHSGANQRETHT
jgi:hypothetical protein